MSSRSPTHPGIVTLMPTPRADLAHLYRRAAFGARAEELDAAGAIGYEAAVDRLLRPPTADPGAVATPPPQLRVDPALPGGKLTASDVQRYLGAFQAQSRAISLWWLRRMVRAEHPFVEKLTLLWHGHWATAIAGVLSARLMLVQNETLRVHGSGDFRELALAMVEDPALLVWLDAAKNNKALPNENLSRELMELFVLGIGHYTEADVREAARALTGWRVNRGTRTAVFSPVMHDEGAKTVLGRTGNFDNRSLVDLLVAEPASARFVVSRFWRRLVSDADPPAEVLSRLIGAYGPGRDVGALLRALLIDPVFRSPAVRRGLVKQPVEYVVGALRALRLVPTAQVVDFLALLGQVPFRPPSVGGWPSGEAWLTSSAAQARVQFAVWAVSRADLSVIAGHPPARRVDAVARLLSVEAWTPRTRVALAGAAGNPTRLVTLALASPEYIVN